MNGVNLELWYKRLRNELAFIQENSHFGKNISEDR